MDSVKLNGLGNPRIPWSFTASSVFLECYLIHRIRRNRDSPRAMDSTRAFGILEIMAMWKSEDSMDPSNHMEFCETHRNMGIPRNSWNSMEFQPIGITECWKSVNSTKTIGFHSLWDSTVRWIPRSSMTFIDSKAIHGTHGMIENPCESLQFQGGVPFLSWNSVVSMEVHGLHGILRISIDVLERISTLGEYHHSYILRRYIRRESISNVNVNEDSRVSI